MLRRMKNRLIWFSGWFFLLVLFGAGMDLTYEFEIGRGLRWYNIFSALFIVTLASPLWFLWRAIRARRASKSLPGGRD
jgi:hypothetical protein